MQAWAGFAQAGAVVAAAVVAANTFKSWRRQKIEERRIDAAEKVLTLTYRTKQAFSVIRSPITSQNAKDEATYELLQNGIDLTSMTSELANKVVESQVIMKRINGFSDLWDSYSSIMPVARAYFGSDIEEIFQSFWRQKIAIQVAAENYPLDTGQDATFTKEISNTIWENRQRTPSDDDKISKALADTIIKAEGILIPVIQFSK